ncbi:type IX secretion system plug protein [Flavobacterium sp. C4GT6]|uniref:type IX secretion system plug protein n=1 Tax=Flavobacterium sp. C4GT6 TaxID=3103818 RepID=UPI002ED4463A
MLKARLRLICLVFLIQLSYANAQVLEEVAPPYNIKTASFMQNGENVYPFFRLGENFTFAFDDLFGNEANYYYTLTHCNYDWTKSQLTVNEYISGFDNQRIQNYQNSFNTLQIYSHYVLSFPNRFTRIQLTGNYILNILNEDREIVMSRRFVVYEEKVSVPLQVKRARGMNEIQEKHNMDFAIKTNAFIFQMPQQNVKVALFQNGRFDNAIYNIKPQYTIGNDLIYKYDKETQFWAGNEYLYFDNKDIRNAVNNVLRVTGGEIYNNILYANEARGSKPYTYYPDINGNFVTNNSNLNVTDVTLEADYAWVFFKLSAPAYFEKDDIYIGGMFNNYTKTDEYKMEYNEKTGMYEKAVMIKQGFNNYMYIPANSKGRVNGGASPDGNFFQTENDYNVIVYYRENNERYDRVIGFGQANSEDIIN